jgi:hypothetical protein
LGTVNQSDDWVHSFKAANPLMSLAKPGNPATACLQQILFFIQVSKYRPVHHGVFDAGDDSDITTALTQVMDMCFSAGVWSSASFGVLTFFHYHAWLGSPLPDIYNSEQIRNGNGSG